MGEQLNNVWAGRAGNADGKLPFKNFYLSEN